jgi:hypothetical protein
MLRTRIAGAGTALVLAITFGVMGATGFALAGGDKTTATTPAASRTGAQLLTVPPRSDPGAGSGPGNIPVCRTPMLVSIPE